jgi:hypothetical protein
MDDGKARPAGKLLKPLATRFFDWFCSDMVKKHVLFVKKSEWICSRA